MCARHGSVVRGLEFVAHLRPMVAYRGMEALIEQMHQDVADARRALNLP